MKYVKEFCFNYAHFYYFVKDLGDRSTGKSKEWLNKAILLR